VSWRTPPRIRMPAGAQEQTRAATPAVVAQPTARLEVVPLPAYAPDSNPLTKRWKQSKP